MKALRNTILFVFSIIILAGCEKMGENDQVTGFWQLVSVQNGTTTTDVTSDQIYWGMQDGIISIRSTVIAFSTYEGGENSYELIGKYTKSDDILYIDELLYHYDSHDEPITGITSLLQKYGFYAIPCHFSTEKDGATLKISDENRTLTFRKS